MVHCRCIACHCAVSLRLFYECSSATFAQESAVLTGRMEALSEMQWNGFEDREPFMEALFDSKSMSPFTLISGRAGAFASPWTYFLEYWTRDQQTLRRMEGCVLARAPFSCRCRMWHTEHSSKLPRCAGTMHSLPCLVCRSAFSQSMQWSSQAATEVLLTGRQGLSCLLAAAGRSSRRWWSLRMQCCAS